MGAECTRVGVGARIWVLRRINLVRMVIKRVCHHGFLTGHRLGSVWVRMGHGVGIEPG